MIEMQKMKMLRKVFLLQQVKTLVILCALNQPNQNGIGTVLLLHPSRCRGGTRGNHERLRGEREATR